MSAVLPVQIRTPFVMLFMQRWGECAMRIIMQIQTNFLLKQRPSPTQRHSGEADAYNQPCRWSTCFLCLWLVLQVLLVQPDISAAYDFESFARRLGPQDAAIVADPDGNILFSHNAHKALIPASTLKILTALTAFHYLGTAYRFPTEFYMDAHGNLKIKGYGDPLLISEVVADISKNLAESLRKGSGHVQDIIIDHTYFEHPIVIPGVTDSSEPYDAPNGALCVNFNTVNFKKTKGKYVSAEPQTPLLPMTLKRIRASGLSQGRIRLSLINQEIFFYAGNLFKYFLESNGLKISGRVTMGHVLKGDRLLLTHLSPFTLDQVVMKMMAFSNNYTANQILLHTGAYVFGAPGTLEKAVETASEYAKNHLKGADIRMSEGSGISRENRITAAAMLSVLNEFKPYHHLLEQEGNDVFKTGTLKDISTRAGYIKTNESALYPYAILINTPGKSARQLGKVLQLILLPADE